MYVTLPASIHPRWRAFTPLLPLTSMTYTRDRRSVDAQVQAVFSNVEALLEFTQGMQRTLTAKMKDRTSVYSSIGGYFLSMVRTRSPAQRSGGTRASSDVVLCEACAHALCA
jgi:hypothetical protein